jgi:topoisomerase IA-like protein
LTYGTNVSLPKGVSPKKISLEGAVKLLDNKN